MRMVPVSKEGSGIIRTHDSSVAKNLFLTLLVSELAGNGGLYLFNRSDVGEIIKYGINVNPENWEMISHVGVSLFALIPVFIYMIDSELKRNKMISEHEVDLRGNPVRRK